MADRIVFGADNIDRSDWIEFIKANAQGDPFQMPQMYSVFEATENYTPVVAGCIDETGRLQGIMEGVRICNGKGVFCSLSARVIVWGGPVVSGNDRKRAEILLKSFVSHIKKDCVYCEIRNIHPADDDEKNIFEKAGFSYYPHLNIIVDVSADEKVMFERLASAKRRNVKKAVSKGLHFSEIKSKDELQEAYGVLKEVYGNTEVPLSSFSLFNAMFDVLVPDLLCKFYKVTHDDKLTGIMVALLFNDSIYEWYVGSKKEYYGFRPNEFIVWNTLLAAKKAGKQFFDFGGAGKPGVKYGVREFKKGFGGEMTETGRFRTVFKKIPWLMGNVAIRAKKFLVNR